MPVYIRRNVAFTPPSLADPLDEAVDDEDFIQDPDQVRVYNLRILCSPVSPVTQTI